MLDGADVSAVGNADDDGQLQGALVSRRELRELRRDLVEAGEDEAVELDLAHGAVAAHRKADRRAHDARLGERGVEHAVRAEPLLQALRHAEHSAERPDVLSHEQNLVVRLHGGRETLGEGLRHRERLHGRCVLRHHASPSNEASYWASHSR